MMVGRPLTLFLLLVLALARDAHAKQTLDPYKVLGVDRNASQRDIQKAFHKLSLQYHPDKNKNKGAQEKFSEINNAYDILSDEEKRKNYDLYGDEKAGGFDAGANFGSGSFGDREGFSYSKRGGPEGWFGMGGQGNSFSFSFGSNPSFGSTFNDLFSNLFERHIQGENYFGSFGGSKTHGSHGSLRPIDAQVYKKEILDQGLTWLFLFYTSSSRGNDMMESIVEDVGNTLQGAIKAGSINCQSEKALCNDFGVRISRSARIFVYSYVAGGISLIEYDGKLDSLSLKSFCIEHLPRFSKRVMIARDSEFRLYKGSLPQVLLLSTKRETPIIWRTLSGVYRDRFAFYDAEVQNIADQKIKNLGVDALPALVGRLVNGEVYVLKSGMTVKDLKTGLNDLRMILESLEKKNKKVAAEQSSTDSWNLIPHLTSSNIEELCSEKTTLCIIGAFRSKKGKERIESILSMVSQMTFTRRQNQVQSSSGDFIRYAMLDAGKNLSFLKSFDKSGFRKSDVLLVAYKPRRGKFAALTGDNAISLEEVESFLSSVLNGDISFSKVLQKPVVK